jgi:hypothetical protein
VVHTEQVYLTVLATVKALCSASIAKSRANAWVGNDLFLMFRSVLKKSIEGNNKPVHRSTTKGAELVYTAIKL